MVKKLLVIILIVIAVITYLPNKILAFDNVISSGNDFMNSADPNKEVINQEKLKSTSEIIYNILFAIALVLAVGVGLVIGIQFIFGSVEEQAKVKETLIPYIIGVIIVFSAFTIWKIVVEIGNDVAPTPAASGNSTHTSSSGTAAGGSSTHVSGSGTEHGGGSDNGGKF